MESEEVEKISGWSTGQAVSFVKHFLGTEMYSKLLQDNQINGNALLCVQLDGWKDIGISVAGHRHALFGWAQEKLRVQRGRVNIHGLSPRGSSNQQGHKREVLQIQGSDADYPFANMKRAKIHNSAMMKSSDNHAQCKRLNTVQIQSNDASTMDRMGKYTKTEKSLLRENYDLKSRAYNRNLSAIRDWFLDGAGPFSREEFICGSENETTSKALKDAIMAVIMEKRSELNENSWTDKDIYNKIRLHRNYLRGTRHNEPRKMPQQRVRAENPNCSFEALEKVSISKETPRTSGSCPVLGRHILESSLKTNFPAYLHSEKPYLATTLSKASHGVLKTKTQADSTIKFHTSIAATMYASHKFITEEEIKWHNDMLIARGAKVEYGMFANSDDGMLDFGSGKLVKKHKNQPYEVWELRVEDLDFSMDMEHLLLPGTTTSVTTLQVGDVIKFPAIYLEMEEYVPDSYHITISDVGESVEEFGSMSFAPNQGQQLQSSYDAQGERKTLEDMYGSPNQRQPVQSMCSRPNKGQPIGSLFDTQNQDKPSESMHPTANQGQPLDSLSRPLNQNQLYDSTDVASIERLSLPHQGNQPLHVDVDIGSKGFSESYTMFEAEKSNGVHEISLVESLVCDYEKIKIATEKYLQSKDFGEFSETHGCTAIENVKITKENQVPDITILADQNVATATEFFKDGTMMNAFAKETHGEKKKKFVSLNMSQCTSKHSKLTITNAENETTEVFEKSERKKPIFNKVKKAAADAEKSGRKKALKDVTNNLYVPLQQENQHPQNKGKHTAISFENGGKKKALKDIFDNLQQASEKNVANHTEEYATSMVRRRRIVRAPLKYRE